ncbi:uncharacterized protein NECHADRAFT_88827 [Fusarium vanettenii 77-13-4]|uniref:Uncharacterized protein n=1 Tax=Fusarium vanettenii (strain ATCC MYA-4622 / CBS 123669 / FGSC 9596 / NRRL 45880 / 77-13-4) TaxID=660122 RepID=C7ZN69_FUSV7|nr:uncharacterized protein NECHADRAFT_88827 [Fusarium vanettenii 77-13-4]EEU34545.1 hypothetical protein NECHADRAFT_88827 [Fusarium vanettenii 77-13-4]
MTGDGLADVVMISNGAISYLPNMGYGRPLQPLPTASSRCIWVWNGGNGWSPGAWLAAFPNTDYRSSVFASDIVGNGCTCLCVADSALGVTRMKFVDLASGNKLYLLNGYSISTPEREFRGFGMADIWIDVDLSYGHGKMFINPQVHQKFWFFTGPADFDNRFKASSPSELSLPQHLLPELDSEQNHELYRALKGLESQQGIYMEGLKPSSTPITATEQAYEMLLIAAAREGRSGVSRVIPREALTHLCRKLPHQIQRSSIL